MSDLCKTFRRQAGTVWKKMANAASLGMALNEETITETALYEIALAHRADASIGISLATKPQEAKHGADWEWWIAKGTSGVSFRVQSKRLFPNGVYQNLLKGGPTSIAPYQQLNKLVRSAQTGGHIPLYCFYNFDHPAGRFYGSSNRCSHLYRGPTFWGCSFADPAQVMAAKSAKLSDLRSIMRPWHEIVCAHTPDLADAGVAFAKRVRSASEVDVDRRELPNYVGRLMSMGRELEPDLAERQTFLDWDFWSRSSDAPDDVAGVVVFEDRED